MTTPTPAEPAAEAPADLAELVKALDESLKPVWAKVDMATKYRSICLVERLQALAAQPKADPDPAGDNPWHDKPKAEAPADLIGYMHGEPVYMPKADSTEKTMKTTSA